MATIEQLIEPVVSAQGFELVRVKLMNTEAGRTLQVMAEDPETGQLVIEQCARLSRALSDVLDDADPVEGEYNLEVSSPGVDRPLTRGKDYAQWAGHKVKVALREALDIASASAAGGRKKFQGRLLGLEGQAVKLRLEDGSGEEVLLPLDAIHSAKLVLTDELLAASKPPQMN